MPRRPWEPRDFLRLRTASDAQVSPDGMRVAFVHASVDEERDEYRSEIYVVPAGGGAPVRWTAGPQDSEPRWSPDGSLLLFVRKERERKPQVWLMRADGGEAWALTDLPKGVAQPAWSPDGTRIVFAALLGGDPPDDKELTPAERNRPRVVEHLVYKLDGVGILDGSRWHLHVVDVAASAPGVIPPPRQITTGDWDDQFPCWSPDGGEIAFVSYREPDRHDTLWLLKDIWVVGADGGEPRKLTRSRGPAGCPRWSPDGTTIAYVGHEWGGESLARTTHVLVIPAAGGEPRMITAALDRSVAYPPYGPPNALAWSPDSQSLLCMVADHGNMPLVRATLDGTTEVVVGGERTITGISTTPDGKRLAFTATAVDIPSDVFVVAGDDERRLTTLNDDWLSAIELGSVEQFTYRGADDWEIEGWMLKPPGFDPSRRYPAVLEIHGGPHGQYGNLFDPSFQAMAGAGYLVIYLNPRGSTGYGEPFALACVDDWGGKDYEDLMAGVDHVIARGHADPDRLAVAGYSYGGYMTAWIVGHTPRFRAAMSGAPVGNGYSFWGTSDIGPLFGQYELGGAPPQEAALHYLERSPIHYLHQCRTPVLFLHHEGDLRCPIGQTEELFSVLRQRGVPAVMVRYPGGFHRYLTHAPSQRVDAAQRTNAWFGKYLGEDKGTA
jgi:dipeptidyl aminopeptidase/acylaminoacyl peptidase